MKNYYSLSVGMKEKLDRLNLGPKFHSDKIYKGIVYGKREVVNNLYSFDIDKNFDSALVKTSAAGQASTRIAVDTISYDEISKDSVYVACSKETITEEQELSSERCLSYHVSLPKGRRTDKFILDNVIKDFSERHL